MTAEPPQTPGKPPRRPTLAETLRAIEERGEARTRRSGLLILLYAGVVVASVLAGIALVGLDPAQPARDAAPVPAPAAAATPTPLAPDADPAADRLFEATLARLQAEGASADARRRTQAHRSRLAQAIDAAGLELRIERFECGPRLCAAWLLGGGEAYDRLDAALPAKPRAPLHGSVGVATPPGKRRHPLLLSIDADTGAAGADGPVRSP